MIQIFGKVLCADWSEYIAPVSSNHGLPYATYSLQSAHSQSGSEVCKGSALRFIVLLLVAALFAAAFSFGLPTPSAAADEGQIHDTPYDIDPDDVARFSLMQYKLFRVPDGYTAGIWGILDPNEVELPATIQIALPTGANVFWFGPVPAGGVTPDTPPFDNFHVYTDEEKGLDIYTATLIDSFEVQIEHYHWGEGFAFPVRSLPNGDHVIRISYTPLHDLDILRLAAFLPPDSIVRDETYVEYLGVGPAGDPAFAMTYFGAQALETYTVEIEYIPPEITARHNQEGIAGGIIVVIAVSIGAVAAVFGLLFFIKKRSKQQSDDRSSESIKANKKHHNDESDDSDSAQWDIDD